MRTLMYMYIYMYVLYVYANACVHINSRVFVKMVSRICMYVCTYTCCVAKWKYVKDVCMYVSANKGFGNTSIPAYTNVVTCVHTV